MEVAIYWFRASIGSINMYQDGTKNDPLFTDRRSLPWLNEALLEMEVACDNLGKATNAVVLSSREFRLVNVLVNRLRQYPRLEGHRSANEGGEKQTTLDMWAKAKVNPEAKA